VIYRNYLDIGVNRSRVNSSLSPYIPNMDPSLRPEKCRLPLEGRDFGKLAVSAKWL
jgi:hypothetical protein